MRGGRLGLLMVGILSACFTGEGLLGAPCLSDADCGPSFECVGTPGACGGEDGGSGVRWPDSPTIYCTDGVIEAPCPEPGTAGFGQDGSYSIAMPSYTETDGIVLDSVTGLEWEPASTNASVPHAEAVMHCDSLTLADREWRLPSRLELASLLDFGGPVPFAGVEDGFHWTSSTAFADTAWAVDFLDQVVMPGALVGPAFVLCVSGEPMVSSFATTTDTLRDELTGLVWQRARYGEALSWLGALDHCEALELDGATDWRLPSAKELLTLVREDQQLEVGLDGANETFWTSSPELTPERSVVIVVPTGEFGADTTDIAHSVRCVRGPD